MSPNTGILIQPKSIPNFPFVSIHVYIPDERIKINFNFQGFMRPRHFRQIIWGLGVHLRAHAFDGGMNHAMKWSRYFCCIFSSKYRKALLTALLNQPPTLPRKRANGPARSIHVWRWFPIHAVKTKSCWESPTVLYGKVIGFFPLAVRALEGDL